MAAASAAPILSMDATPGYDQYGNIVVDGAYIFDELYTGHAKQNPTTDYEIDIIRGLPKKRQDLAAVESTLVLGHPHELKVGVDDGY